MATDDLVDVAVVGLGPVGITLAGLLGRAGLRVLAVDKAPDVYAQPRAVGFDHDAMRIFQRLGVADAIGPHVAPFREGEYRGADGRVIQRVVHMPPPYPQAWPPHFTCDQPGLEDVLRAAVTAMPSVRVALGVALVDFRDEGETVALQFADAQGDRSACRARYLVACDGGSSPVRRALGVSMQSLEYDQAWIVVDVKVDDPAALARLPVVNVQYCEPERPSTFINCPGNHRRWEFMVLPGEPVEGVITEARLWQLLGRWLRPGEARIWRSAAYRFHALIADEWRRGRVLLAGDAAHMTPPFLGQGMCQGLRDAGNLAWKLGQVVGGAAGDWLLDTYAAERRPHVTETTRIAKEFGRIISERDPERARARDARLRDGDGRPRTLLRQELIPGLCAGLVSRSAPLAGRVFPQPMVDAADGTAARFDDVTGAVWRLVLVATGAARDAAAPDRFADVIASARSHAIATIVVADRGPAAVPAGTVVVTERDRLLAEWLAAAGCCGALVRPDHYVFGGFADPDGARAAIDELAAAAHRKAGEAG
ncbi:MAG: bifunctional 3-(3-hydroxy-phenyl)propionate/3-hydroxycinnamic acid hydroxylase [Burkholderiales bacterium]|nr:bifunctional 3-(3-hydroxy-phenyl)propionate/3-hydroxycinnamic acid hydroxylase [Burkholderiales bacterium]